MYLSGNKGLLDGYLVAFFASRTAPPEALDLATQWAREIAQTDKIVISGFHSPIERAVLDILLAHNHPVVVVLGRSLYRKIPQHLSQAYQQNQVLFISVRDMSRQSGFSAQVRNWSVADMARETVFAPYEPTSQLSSLHHYLLTGAKKVAILGL